jgi:putative colanic acid biosynthesis acetyltransferase WcaF
MRSPLRAAPDNDPFMGAPSFSLCHRLGRLAWATAWVLLASWTPAPLHRWRVLLLQVAGANVHSSAHVYSSVRVWYPRNLEMAAHACLGPKVNCYNMAPIQLGVRAVVSQGAYLCAGTHDIDDRNHQLVTKPIRIGDDAWIAAEAFVGPGVAVGDRAVLGARGVLFKNAEPNGVYLGNPAKLVRFRRVG